jgi:hypothetical protein
VLRDHPQISLDDTAAQERIHLYGLTALCQRQRPQVRTGRMGIWTFCIGIPVEHSADTQPGALCCFGLSEEGTDDLSSG